MKENRILIIEDEIAICDILSYALKKEGFQVRYVINGQDGLDCLDIFKPNIVILDLMLPDISGFEVCKKITSKYKIPILMSTARNDIVDKILGLELGADDYITKPFDIREVVARVKVALRRMEDIDQYTGDQIIINEAILLEKSSRTVYKDGNKVVLKPREFDLILLFCENKNIVFSRDEILDKVWGRDFEGGERTVDVHVQRVRKKLDKENLISIIDTVFGIGYKMNK